MTGRFRSGSGRASRFAAVLVWLVVGCAVAGVALRVGGVRWYLLVPALAWYPWALALAVVVLAVVLASRRWAAAAVLGLTLVVGAVPLVPRVVPDGDPAASGQASGQAAELVVGSLNVFYGNADPGQVVELAQRVDVLVLLEVDGQAVSDLDEAGLGEVMPYRVVQPRPGPAGSGVWSRRPLREVGGITGARYAMPLVAVQMPGGAPPVRVQAVHTVAPVLPAEIRQWEREMAALAQVDADVLAGDFNATPDHAQFRALLREGGYRDVADVTGEAWRPTWPGRIGKPPLITLDHCLTGAGVGVDGFEVLRVADTDHRGLVCRTGVPAG